MVGAFDAISTTELQTSHANHKQCAFSLALNQSGQKNIPPGQRTRKRNDKTRDAQLLWVIDNVSSTNVLFVLAFADIHVTAPAHLSLYATTIATPRWSKTALGSFFCLHVRVTLTYFDDRLAGCL